MRIHYIVAFYLGDRGTPPVNDYLQQDRYHYVKKHIEVLNSLELPHIYKATFIISEYNKEIDSNVGNIVKEFPCKIPIEVYHRKNEGYSYAGWNEVITQSIKDKEDTDYYFLIEDDYIPYCDKFYQPFVDECTENVAFVSQVWRENHAAVSNGLLSGIAAKTIMKHYDSVFCINEKNDTYAAGVINQVNFLNYAKRLNMLFSDVCDTSFQIFLNKFNFQFFGNPKKQVLIVPESTRDWEIAVRDEKAGKWRHVDSNKKDKSISDLDISVLNKFRNSRAKLYSKNPIVYTEEEAETFFKKNRNNVYVIYEDQGPSGYVQVIEEDKIYVQPHLRKRWDNGHDFSVLYNLLCWISEKYTDREIYSKISENNDFLIQALKACGFIEDSVIKNAIVRKDITHNIIVLKKTS